MASLYEQLMASKGAPKAAAATNSTQLRKAPVSLRSAMRKYAEGGDVTSTVPDYSRAYGALGGAEGVNALRNQLLGMGISEDIIGSAFSKYYTPEPQQGMSPQTMTPPPPPPEEPRYEPRYQPDIAEPKFPEKERPPERPVMPEIYPQDYAGIKTTDTSQQPQGPQTSYRMNDDGSRTEIGYDGQPIANYTPEQLAMHNATTGVTPSEYRYVFNGEGYDKLPNGPQTGYGPTPEMETKRPPPPEESRYEPRYPEKERPPEEPRYEEPVAPPPMPYYEPVAPQMPYYPEMPMPETYIEPEVPMTQPELPFDLSSYRNNQTQAESESLNKLKRLLSGGGGGGSLEEQRRIMALLEMLKGR